MPECWNSGKTWGTTIYFTKKRKHVLRESQLIVFPGSVDAPPPPNLFFSFMNLAHI